MSDYEKIISLFTKPDLNEPNSIKSDCVYVYEKADSSFPNCVKEEGKYNLIKTFYKTTNPIKNKAILDDYMITHISNKRYCITDIKLMDELSYITVESLLEVLQTKYCGGKDNLSYTFYIPTKVYDSYSLYIKGDIIQVNKIDLSNFNSIS